MLYTIKGYDSNGACLELEWATSEHTAERYRREIARKACIVRVEVTIS